MEGTAVKARHCVTEFLIIRDSRKWDAAAAVADLHVK